jgi:hypothetical protein
MDVLCVGMYRACSTWQYEVASHLVERHLSGRPMGYVTGESYASLVAREPQAEEPRVLKSHEGHPAFARALAAGKAKAVYSLRDPRDVVYSMLHKRSQTFDTFLRGGMIHQIVANDRYWRSQPQGTWLVQHYETLVADPAGGVRELANFLDIKIDRAESREIAAEYSFEANQKRTKASEDRLRHAGIDLHDPKYATHSDDRTLLHWNHLREGRTGGWRKTATPRERAILERILGEWLGENGFSQDEGRPKAALAMHDEFAIARGWLACEMRCAALQHPRLGRIVKRVLGISVDQRRETSRGRAGRGQAA